MKCIYAIINLTNGKIYIGSTSNFSRRKNEHLSMLKRGKHHSPHLQNSWDINGADNFIFIILEKLESASQIYLIEQKYLDKYKSYNKSIGYNISKKANDTNESNYKKVIQYDLNGKQLNIFENLALAGEFINIHYSGISNAANGKCKTCKGFVWVFEKDFNESLLKEKVILANNRKHSSETILKMKKVALERLDNGKIVLQYDLNDNFIQEFKSVRQASLLTGIGNDSIYGYCTGKYKKGRSGFKWKFKS